jgi:threonine/homoserine/homoserine lactone efflux protein
MDVVASLPAFVAAVILISASPGPAMALTVRRATTGGWRGAVPTVLGLEAGLYVWALAAAAGFAALVAASEVAFLVLRVVGAAVLLFLGARALLAARRHRHGSTADTGAGAPPERPAGRARARAFGEGALVQLANPKAAVLMLALYPQFVPPDRPLFLTTSLLALLQVAIETALYLGLAAGVGRAGAWFQRPHIRRRVDTVTGTVLVGLGLRVAAARR